MFTAKSTLGLFLMLLLLLLLLWISGLMVFLVLLDGSSGVPRPSVFIVSTLLARERLMLWEERLEGARPKSWRRRRRYGFDGSEEFRGGGFSFLSLFERWWWARREEMAGPRDESSDADGRSLTFAGDMVLVGDAERLGGEELGVISFNGAQADGADRVFEEFSGTEWGSIGVSSSKYMADSLGASS